MPSPTLVFGFLLATLYGSVFHVLVGGDARRLALFLLAGWLGFALGQIVAEVLSINLILIGRMRFFSATSGSLIALLVVMVLTRRQNTKGFT